MTDARFSIPCRAVESWIARIGCGPFAVWVFLNLLAQRSGHEKIVVCRPKASSILGVDKNTFSRYMKVLEQWGLVKKEFDRNRRYLITVFEPEDIS